MTNELNIALKAAKEAGTAILKVYNSDNFDITAKSDDSPLTKADSVGHKVIMKHLSQTAYPILSEEGKMMPYEVRKNWNCFWMVDPLDGTKEFIKRNGEFTVNIALIKNNCPVLGVIYAPVLKTMYWASPTEGAWKQIGRKKPTQLTKKNIERPTKIVASRSHLSQETLDFIAQYPNAEMTNIGSSLKFMLVAEGSADIYPRFAPTMEWDIAAGHGICQVAGFSVINANTKTEMTYNKENLLNPFFIVS